ncbi:MAG: 2OG-Fe(II) oxygenase, partial [Rhodospirillaceae bacterium]|nr:2OG-Fe(II) oxygenase [Rhodospirillaceae bacterium]
MPLLEVAGVGVVPFPVPDSSVSALAERAERAAFGRGGKTVLDRTVRDTWQFSPDEVSIGGKTWTETLHEILGVVTKALGCPSGSVEAQLHKLLLYEQGGHFAPHRDSEKADGMVATLVISLPAWGKGGELVVRHRDHETWIDMRTEDPSEVTYAAFYADCEHEVRPVTEGHRLSLVFNLVRTDSTFASAPDSGHAADGIAEWLANYAVAACSGERPPVSSPDTVSLRYGDGPHCDDPGDEPSEEDRPPEKLIWLLEHEYSEAGLSFSALKNRDDAVARTLIEVAQRAGCATYAAILRIRQSIQAVDRWISHGERRIVTVNEEYPFEDLRWLESWAEPGGARPEFGKVPVTPDEFIPSEYLDGINADEERVEYPTTNEALSVERCYRLAVLVVWPADLSVDVVARGGVANAVNYLAFLRRNGARQPADRKGPLAQAERLVSIWPEPVSWSIGEDWLEPCAGLIEELVQLGDPELTERFLAGSVLPHYTARSNNAICKAALEIGPIRTGDLLGRAVPTRVAYDPDTLIGLVSSLDRATRGGSDAEWDSVLRELARRICDRLVGLEGREPGRSKLSGQSCERLFELFQRLGMVRDSGPVAESLVFGAYRVEPYRELPAALEALERTAPGLGKGRSILWRHSVLRLLERSGFPPKEPIDWVVRAEIPVLPEEPGRRRNTARNWSCAECCRQLQDFCDDAVETTCHFPARRDIRGRLVRMIRQLRLDMDCHTERRGNPHRLVCVKNRASYQRRLAEYAEDIEWMQKLANHEAAALPEAVWHGQLRDAIRRGEGSRGRKRFT